MNKEMGRLSITYTHFLQCSITFIVVERHLTYSGNVNLFVGIVRQEFAIQSNREFIGCYGAENKLQSCSMCTLDSTNWLSSLWVPGFSC